MGNNSLIKQNGASWKTLLKNVEVKISIITLYLLTIVVFMEVILRYVFYLPQPYSGELSRLLNIIIVFLGLAYAEKRDAHVSVDYFNEKLFSPRLKEVINIIFLLVKAFVALVILIGTIQIVQKGGDMKTAAMGIPLLVFYLPAIIGFTLLFLTILQKTVAAIPGLCHNNNLSFRENNDIRREDV